MAIAVPLAIAAVGAGVAAAGAAKQNAAIRRSAAASNAAYATQAKQVSNQASVEQMKRQNEAARVAGRLRVAAASAGVNIEGGSYADLVQQNNYDAGLNLAILNQNRSNEIARVQSGANAHLADLQGHLQSVLLSSLQGGVQGFSTGLQISNAAGALGGTSGTADTSYSDTLGQPGYGSNRPR